MPPTLLTTTEDLEAYVAYLKNAPGASLWQSLEWRPYQESLGRQTRLYGLKMGTGGSKPGAEGGESGSVFAATALVVIDRTTFGLATWDIPRGPLFESEEAGRELLQEIVEDAKRERCMALYFSPPQPLSTIHYPLSTSLRAEQPEATLIIHLTQSEESILAHMKPKGRYNISVAKKHGVEVRASSDIAAFSALMMETSRRDGFRPLPSSHYAHFLKGLPGSFLLLAYEAVSEELRAGSIENPVKLTAPSSQLQAHLSPRRTFRRDLERKGLLLLRRLRLCLSRPYGSVSPAMGGHAPLQGQRM